MFVIDSTIGRNLTFELDFDNSKCNFNDEDKNRGEDGEEEVHMLCVDIFGGSDMNHLILKRCLKKDNENDNFRVDVFKFTVGETEATLPPGTYGVKVWGHHNKNDCTMTLIITSLAVDDATIPIRYVTFNQLRAFRDDLYNRCEKQLK